MATEPIGTVEPSFGELLQQALIERLIMRCSIEQAQVRIHEGTDEYVMSCDEARSYLLGRLIGHWAHTLAVPDERLGDFAASRPQQEEVLPLRLEQLAQLAQKMNLVERVVVDPESGEATIVLPDMQADMSLEEAAGYLRDCIGEHRPGRHLRRSRICR